MYKKLVSNSVVTLNTILICVVVQDIRYILCPAQQHRSRISSEAF